MSHEFPPKIFEEDDARDSFLVYMWEFIGSPDPNDESPKGKHFLMDYVYAWLHGGNAVEATAGSYETFLFTITRIIDVWVRNPSVLHCRNPGADQPFERHLKGIFHPDQRLNTAPSKYEYEWKKFQLLKNYD
jgi:hypothetical protein